MIAVTRPNFWQSVAEFSLVLIFVFLMSTIGILAFTIRIFTVLMPPEVSQAQEELKSRVDSRVATVCSAQGYNQLIVLRGDEFFPFGEFEEPFLKPEGRRAIETIASVLRQRSESLQRIQIEGHASWEPSEAGRDEDQFALHNMELSSDRAQTVFRLLIRNGVPPDRMTVAGLGFYKPVFSDPCAPVDTDAGPEPWRSNNVGRDRQARNRRINLLIIYASPAPADSVNVPESEPK